MNERQTGIYDYIVDVHVSLDTRKIASPPPIPPLLTYVYEAQD